MPVDKAPMTRRNNRPLLYGLIATAITLSIGIATENRDAAIFIAFMAWLIAIVGRWIFSRTTFDNSRSIAVAIFGFMIYVLSLTFVSQIPDSIDAQLLCCWVMTGIIFLLFRQRKDRTKRGQPPAPAASATPVAPAVEVSARDEDRWRAWAAQNFRGPLSQTLATAAAAIRALELRQAGAQVAADALAAGNAWAPPPDFRNLPIGKSVEEYWRRWADARFPGPRSRVLAATASALRAIEMGRTDAEAIRAAENSAGAWGPTR